MCGPSSNQETMYGNSAALSTLLTANYNQRFADQSELLNSIKTQLEPIVMAGPDQQGFGARELAALKTESGEVVGRNYAKATQALNNQLGTRGGGSGDTTSGVDEQLRGELASRAANEASNEDLAITRANYAQGRNNWSQATAGLHALAQEENPTPYASLGLDANKTAFSQASEIQQMKNQKEAAIAGGLTSLAMDAATFGAGGIANLGEGESFGEGFGDFFKGGISALGGKG